MAITVQMRTQISQLYVAMFGRAPDAEGLGFWVNKLNAGTSFADVANQMFATAPARDYYPAFATNSEIITSFYTNVLGRSPDAEGLAFWVGKLNAAGATPGSVIAQMIGVVAGYTGADPAGIASAALFNNKVAVAQYYAEHGGNIASADDILVGVTADPATVTAAKAVIDNTVGVIELTNGTDVVVGASFNAGLVYTPGGDDRINSLQDEDKLTGTGTNATLTAQLGNANDNGATVITPSLTNIAKINVGFTGSGGGAVTGLDLQDGGTALKELNINRVSQSINFAEVGNIQSVLSTMSVNNTNANQQGMVEISFGQDVLKGDNTGSLTLNNVQLRTLTIGQNVSGINSGGVNLQGYENLTINSTGAGTNQVKYLGLPSDTDTDGVITISGKTNLILGEDNDIVNNNNNNLIEAADVWQGFSGIQQAGGRLAKIDASGFEGNLTLVLDNILDVGKADTSGVKQDVTVSGGKGNDTFVLFDAVESGDKLEGNGGTDTLQFYVGSSLASTATSFENARYYANGGNIGPVDYDFLPDTVSSEIRNIGNNGFNNQATGAVRVTLLDMSATAAAGLVVRHSTTFNNQIQNTTVEAAVKANTANDTIGVTIAEGTNVDPRFNFTLDTVVANTATSTTASASTFENVTITDSDSESNSVELENFAQHTGTIKLTGGKAGTFLNLDVDTAGADLYGAIAGTQQGLLGINTDGAAADAAAGIIWDAVALATQVRIGAATIDASGEESNVIVRVSTNAADVNGAQTITMGKGNDTVIFDFLNDARAGLTISDKVAGGDGNDWLVIDGNATRISLGASEWTNVTGFENLRLVGNGSAPIGLGIPALIGQNSYNLTLTDALIAANHDTSGLLNIVNDNDSANDAAAGADTAGTGVESGVTIDARSLAATSHFSYNGEEGASATLDRLIFGDANVNGGNVLDGGAVDNLSATFGGNGDVFEVRNTATVTTGDLANVKNFGIIAGVNDQATAQTLVLQLNDTVVDAMVDSYHTSTTTQRETLFVRMQQTVDTGFVVIPQAAILDLDTTQLTGRSIVNVTLDAVLGSINRDNVKLGMGLAEVFNFVSGATLNDDTVTLSATQFGINNAAIGTTVVASGNNIVYGALGSGAVTDRIYVVEGADANGNATNDSAIYFDADGSGVGAAVLIGIIDNATLSTGSGLTIVA